MSNEEERSAIGTWNEWRRLVFAKLKEHDDGLECLEERYNKLNVKLAMMSVKVGMISALVGTAAGTIVALIVTALIKSAAK